MERGNVAYFVFDSLALERFVGGLASTAGMRCRCHFTNLVLLIEDRRNGLHTNGIGLLTRFLSS